MRRVLLVVSVAAFALALTPSVHAMPKNAITWNVWCDFDGNGETSFLATGNSRPAWALPWSPGDAVSGGIFMGGSQTVTYPDGTVVEFELEPPGGLGSKLTEWRVELADTSAGVTYVADPAWIFFPPGAAEG
jgi:hypothetical protein